MSINRLRAQAVGLAGTLLLSACTILGPDFKRPQVPSWLAGWKGGSLESLAVEPRSPRGPQTQEWWRNFKDPVLDQLVAEAQRVNPSVRIAGIRIMEARAQLGIAGSTLYPQFQQATGELLRAGERRAGAPDSSATSFSAGLQMWPLVICGTLKIVYDVLLLMQFRHVRPPEEQ